MTVAFNITTGEYSQNCNVPIDSKCNGFTAINIGSTKAIVNGVPLNGGTPGTNNGEAFSVGGNSGEVFKGRVTISFPSGSGNVLIIQKYYL